MPVIDLHCHVLPGIDDGPATIEGSLALARAAAAGGTRTVVATPHVNWRYPTDAATIAAAVAALRERLAAEGVRGADGAPLQVRGGAELALTQIPELPPGELERLSLGGGGWLLVEAPFSAPVPHLDGLLLELMRGGHRVVVAHPERCAAFLRDPRMLARLVRAGALTSVTAGSLGGHFGAPARRFALQLARDGLLHNVASDAHDAVHRPPVIATELARASLAPLARWLTEEVPRAVLDGGEVPPRPRDVRLAVEPARRWLKARR